MATTKGPRSCAQAISPRSKVVLYNTPEYHQWSEDKAKQLAQKNGLPFCTKPPAEKMVTMTTKNGGSFSFNSVLTFLEPNVDPKSTFIHSIALNSIHKERLFNYGNMEAARKIIWRSISPLLKDYKNTKQKWQRLITPACFSLLSSIVKYQEGEDIIEQNLFDEKPSPAIVKKEEEPKDIVIPKVINQYFYPNPGKVAKTVYYELPTLHAVVSEETPKIATISFNIEQETPTFTEEKEEKVMNLLGELPSEKLNSFELWFCKRMNNFTGKTHSFDYYIIMFPNTLIHHLKNWIYRPLPKRTFKKQRKQPKAIAESTTTDIQESKSEKEENVVFSDERITVRDQGYITTQDVNTNLQKFSMGESNWHVKNIMSKPIVFSRVEWKVGQTAGTQLLINSVPGDVLKGPHYNLCSTFTFFHGSPKIRILVNGNKFQSGRILAAFIPRLTSDNALARVFSYQQLTAGPHVILDASVSNSGIIELPFVHMNTYFNTCYERRHQTLGTLVYYVFNALQAATSSSQTVDITSWISFENCQLHQPTIAHEVKLPKWKKITHLPQAEALEGALKAAVPMVKDLLTPMATGFGDVLGGASNCDKPTDPIEISRWVPNTVSSLNFGDGIDKSNRLSLYPGLYTLSDSELIATTRDDMNLKTICKIPARNHVESWTTTKASGQLLVSLPLTPALCSTVVRNTEVTPNVRIYTTTPLSYNARMFKFYRGSLKLKVQIIASLMHTGRLQVSYGAAMPSIGSFDESNYLNVFTIDLQEKHEVEFVIPFMAERTWLRCDRLTFVGDKTLDDDTHFYENFGTINVHVLNRLCCPDTVSQKVDVNFFLTAGDDLEFAVPSDLYGCAGIGTPIIVPPKAQAESLTTQEPVTEREDEGVITLTKGIHQLSTTGQVTMSENAMDLKTVARRYYKVYSNITKSQTFYLQFPNTPTLSGQHRCFNGKNGHQFRTHLSHLTEQFTFWRGSLRYKLLVQPCSDVNSYPSQQAIIRVFHVPGVFTKPNFTGITITDKINNLLLSEEAIGTMVMETHIQGSMEFEIPFYTPYSMLDTIVEGDNARSATGTIFVSFKTNSTSSTFILELYQAAGDDFSLNYYRCPPRLQFYEGSEDKRDLSDIAHCIIEKDELVDVCQSKETPTAEALFGFPSPSEMRSAVTSTTEASNSVTQVCNTASNLLQQVTNAVTNATSTEEEEVPDTEEDSDIFSTTIRFISQQLSGLSSTLFNTLKIRKTNLMEYFVNICNGVCALKTFTSSTSILQKACALVSLVSSIVEFTGNALKDKLITITMSVLNHFNGSKQGHQLPIAENAIIDYAPAIVSSLVIGACALTFKTIPTDKETTDLCKNISEKLRLFNFGTLAITNINRMWTQVKDLVEWLIEYLLQKFDPVSLAVLEAQKQFAGIEEWAHFIDSLDNENYEDKVNYDYEFKNKLFNAVDKSRTYLDLIIRGKLGREATVIREYSRKITEIGNKCLNAKNTLPFRKDPFCIAMFGETGIGKSGCITSLGFDIMDNLGYPRYNRWCPINCNEKFFSENYRQQSAIYFDDFSALNSEEQYKNFFNLKANTSYPLDMAFRKGEYFNSDFIFMTTNTSHPRPNFVTHHQALLRRRDILIEADFAMEGMAERAASGEFIRQLDNSHVKFRVCDSVNPEATPGPWMTYPELVEYCSVRARNFINNQQNKLTHDLTRAGYIVPTAENDNYVKVFSKDSARACEILRMFDFDLIDHIDYTPVRGWHVKSTAPTEIIQEWTEFVAYCTSLGTSHVEILDKCSYKQKANKPLLSKIVSKLTSLKDYLVNKIKELYTKYKWIEDFCQWPVQIVGIFAAFGLIYKGAEYVAHKCICTTLRFFGYRCGKCGKWPKFLNSTNQPWLLSEWRKLYGTAPYIDGYITTIEEENAIRSVSLQAETTQLVTGTAIAETVYNNDLTKGQGPMRVVANNSPYATKDNGQARITVVAHNQTNSKGEIPNQVAVACSQQVSDLIHSKVFPRTYRVRFLGDDEFPYTALNAVGFAGRKYLFPSHFFLGLEKNGGVFEVYHSNAWVPVIFEPSRYHKLPNKDIVIYDMPVTFQLCADITKHFISEKDLSIYRKGAANLCELTDKLTFVMHRVNVTPVERQEYECKTGTIYETYVAQNAWKYPISALPGACGSLLIAETDKIQGRILGIHSCGTGVHGFSQLVTREMLLPFVDQKLGTPVPEAEFKLSSIVPPGHFGRIGKSKSGMFHQSTKTDIIKTKIHGIISEPVTFHSVLDPRDSRMIFRGNPLTKGIGKYGIPFRQFNQQDRKIINEYFRDQIRYLELVRQPEILTEEEMIGGIEGVEGLERLPMNTSPGFPFIRTRPIGQQGKAYLFDINTNKIQDQELRTKFEQRDRLAQLNERVESIWVDCLKDERRALEKIQSGSTRVFTIPPVDYSLLCRKYTLDYSAAIRKSRHFIPSKVGIDPQSLEWTELYYSLAQHSDFCVAGDYSRFDGSIPPEFIFDFFMNIYYFWQIHGNYDSTTLNKILNVLTVLADEATHTIHLARDQFYMTHGGNKSGNPLTVILNTETNDRYLAHSWLHLARKHNPQLATMYHYNKHVKRAIYGDDNLLSIHADVIDWFNQETISAFLEEFGIIYTNEEKTGITKYKKLSECGFLKQTFHEHEEFKGIIVPHMKETTILELLNWTKEAPDQDQLLEDNCNDALRFAYFYGRQYFEQLRDKIIKALESIELKLNIQMYNDYHFWFMHKIGKI